MHRSLAGSAAAVGAALLVTVPLVAADAAVVPAGTSVETMQAETMQLAAAGTFTVLWRGNGHGIGMSQYGAQGAALRGLTARQILGFYYPHTNLVVEKPSSIRVRLTTLPKNPLTVLSTGAALAVTNYGRLPTGKYRRFRLVPSGAGLALQGLPRTAPATPGGKPRPIVWTTLRAGLPGREHFSSASGWVQALDRSARSSTRYHGIVAAIRVGSGEWIVNQLSLNNYVAGVVPREVPASWNRAAVRAQAIAARTYAERVRDAAPAGSRYDICDNTDCQVYGGMAHYNIAGARLYTDDPAALIGNRNKVLRYQGEPILAMYSASNGGATVAGGFPYLPGRADPYDTTASGDPYLDQSETVPVARLARSFGLRTATALQVVRRDGHGPWGGRVLSATVTGTRLVTAANGTRSTKTVRVAATGARLGDLLGVGTDYLRFVRG